MVLQVVSVGVSERVERTGKEEEKIQIRIDSSKRYFLFLIFILTVS